jgi:hypothetical protein
MAGIIGTLRTRIVNRLNETRLSKRPGQTTRRSVLYSSLFILIAVVLISIFLALGTPDTANALGIGVAAAAISGAAGGLGASAGFLFGLPRARFVDQPGNGAGSGSSSTAAPPSSSGSIPAVTVSLVSTSAPAQSQTGQGPTAVATTAAHSMHYLTNSNLIKVSDWLTTIIIGLGLVNLTKLIPAIRRLGRTLKAPLGGTPYAGTVGVSLVISTGLACFLLTYLWTSIRVRELLEDAERQAEKDVVPKLVGSKVSQAMEDIGATSLQLSISNKTASSQISILGDAIVETQYPDAGTLVVRGSQVIITIRSSP